MRKLSLVLILAIAGCTAPTPPARQNVMVYQDGRSYGPYVNWTSRGTKDGVVCRRADGKEDYFSGDFAIISD